MRDDDGDEEDDGVRAITLLFYYWWSLSPSSLWSSTNRLLLLELIPCCFTGCKHDRRISSRLQVEQRVREVMLMMFVLKMQVFSCTRDLQQVMF